MFETLLVPLDGSPFSEQALGPAEFIAECTGASLELIRVHVPQLAGETQERSWDDVLRQGARRYLDDAAKRERPSRTHDVHDRAHPRRREHRPVRRDHHAGRGGDAREDPLAGRLRAPVARRQGGDHRQDA